MTGEVAPIGVPGFIAAQLVGMLVALVAGRLLWPRENVKRP